jgi:uncharacterized LabA/DUF88 family protein
VGKNVAVFVDVANIFYAAKAAGVDIDYVTLLKSASAGRDLVRAYAYTGLDPDNENQRNFHDFLRRSNYKVVSKDIRKYGDGKIKANLDIELVVDMMKTARNLDIAIVVSGDGDFAPAIRAVQEMGVRCEVISFRGNTSSDLIEVADLFTDITQLARVEKGSRSGRRVASDDDLSMTEVPDKQTEGTGAGRSRGGRGRGRTRTTETVSTTARGRGRPRSTTPTTSGNGTEPGLKALPGERLSKAVGSLTEADLAAAEVFTMDAPDGSPADVDLDIDLEQAPGGATDDRDEASADGQRRRRRRGGRGRGRGRGRDEVDTGPDEDRAAVSDAAVSDGAVRDDVAPKRRSDRGNEASEDEAPLPSRPRTDPFGAVWDSQLGTPTTPTSAGLEPLPDDDDLDEPEIPEYLIAEQRRGTRSGRGAGGGRGPRGGRSAYQSAMERERYGRGSSGGINRYPDVSGRTSQPGRTGSGRDDRAPARSRDDRPRGAESAPRGSSEPWSDVPPELEALLRAQVAGSATPSVPTPAQRSTEVVDDQAELAASADAAASTDAEVTSAPKRRTTRKTTATRTKSAAKPADVATEAEDSPAPKRRASRSKAAAASTDAEEASTSTRSSKPKSTRSKASTSAKTTASGATSDIADAALADPAAADSDVPSKPAPRKRTTRKAPATKSSAKDDPAAAESTPDSD